MRQVAMSTTLRLAVLVGLVVSLSVYGRPAFNSDRPELIKDSQAAGAELNSAFERTHVMFRYVEFQSIAEAEKERTATIAQFQKALDMFRGVEKLAPNQELVAAPKTADDMTALDDFKRHLKTENLSFPKTEKQLAELAVVLIDRHTNVLRETQLKGGKGDNQRLRKLIKSQALLLELGILTSIAWDIAPRAPRK